MSRVVDPVIQHARRFYCAECGYTLLDERNWMVHREWHRRELARRAATREGGESR